MHRTGQTADTARSTERVLMDFEIFDSKDNNIDKIFIRDVETHKLTGLLQGIAPALFAMKAKARVLAMLAAKFPRVDLVKDFIKDAKKNESGKLYEQEVLDLIAQASLSPTGSNTARKQTSSASSPSLSDEFIKQLTETYLNDGEKLTAVLMRTELGTTDSGIREILALDNLIKGRTIDTYHLNNLQQYMADHDDSFHPALITKVNEIVQQAFPKKDDVTDITAIQTPVLPPASSSSSKSNPPLPPVQREIAPEEIVGLLDALSHIKPLKTETEYFLSLFTGRPHIYEPTAEPGLRALFLQNIAALKANIPAYLGPVLDQAETELRQCGDNPRDTWQTAKAYRSLSKVNTSPASSNRSPTSESALIKSYFSKSEQQKSDITKQRMENLEAAKKTNIRLEIMNQPVFRIPAHHSALRAFWPFLTGEAAVTERTKKRLYVVLNQLPFIMTKLSPETRVACLDAEDRCMKALEKFEQAKPPKLPKLKNELSRALHKLTNTSLSVTYFIDYVESGTTVIDRSAYWRLDDFVKHKSAATRAALTPEWQAEFDLQLKRLRGLLDAGRDEMTALV